MNASSESESYILHILTISLQLFSVTKNSYTIRFGLSQPTFRSYDWNLLASCKYFNLPYFQQPYLLKYLEISLSGYI